MPARFDKLGISFQYPENWTLDDTDAVLALGVPFPNFARTVLPANEDEKKKFFEFVSWRE